MKRIFRFVVSFLLICVILVNCSPIRAQATAAEAILLSSVVVNPSIAVTAVLFGLGVMAVATATAAFTKLVDEVTADMVDKGLISSQGVDMYRTDADGAATYLVNQELVEAVREYLFEKEVVSVEEIPNGFALYNGTLLPIISEVSGWPYLVIQYISGDGYYVHFSTTPFSSFSGGTSVANKNVSWPTLRYKTDGSSPYVDSGAGPYSVAISVSSFIWANHDILADDGSVFIPYTAPVFSEITVSDGLSAGEIASQDKTFTEGYSEWVSGAKTLPTLRDGVQTDVESAYIALGMGLTQEETMAMTQAAVQSGVGTYEGTGTTADTITASGLKGWLDTLRLSMVAGFSDVITGIKDFFTPSGNLEAYALDLKLLFPFCIPFDLFNLLKALQADPVAPHFDFELDFGSLGRFPVSVDFSEWNDLASLLRTLETALFVVGLAVGTRKLIGG